MAKIRNSDVKFDNLTVTIVGSSANEIPNKKLVCEDLQTWLYKNHTAFAMSGQVNN